MPLHSSSNVSAATSLFFQTSSQATADSLGEWPLAILGVSPLAAKRQHGYSSTLETLQLVEADDNEQRLH